MRVAERLRSTSISRRAAGFAVLAAVGVLLPWGCFSWLRIDRVRRVAAIESGVRELAGVPQEKREPILRSLAAARERAGRDELPLTAVLAMEGRFAAIAADDLLLEAEIAHFLEMLEDIPNWCEPDDPVKYMGNR